MLIHTLITLYSSEAVSTLNNNHFTATIPVNQC